MENASKALLIAAAVLVVIILVAVGMKIYSSTTGTQKVATDTGKSISDKAGDATKFATEQITGVKAIDYGSKTKETIEPGDDIIIGGTEKFKVFSVGNDGIKAIPYYNLKHQAYSGPIKQFTKEEAMYPTIIFLPGPENYIEGASIDIDMSLIPEYNNYVNLYENTLKSMGAGEITVRTATYSELENCSYDIMNPGNAQNFWVGSFFKYGSTYYWYCVDSNRKGFLVNRGNSAGYGIRPIIIIK